jgi:hypothetical protein
MKFQKALSSILLCTAASQCQAFNLFTPNKVNVNTNVNTNTIETEKSVTVNNEMNKQRQSPIFEKNNHDIPLAIRNTCISLALSCSVFFTPNMSIDNININNDSTSNTLLTSIHAHPPTALAADYSSFTDEQKAVAEAWRIVDNNFIDRTFNNQDWFQMRQDAVIKKKYKNNQEARDAIDKMVGSLGDKYTRYLPPAKYRSIVDAATGTLAGIGVEISTNKETAQIYASDVEPYSPALNGMLFIVCCIKLFTCLKFKFGTFNFEKLN